MRTHTAMHILCGVIWRDYGASVTGGNMDPLKGRMDFEFETMRQELVATIEEAVNVEVAAARPVRANILPREEAFQIPDLIRTKINLLPEGITEVRTVELVGLDLQADGGTRTASITGAWVALNDAIQHLLDKKVIDKNPLHHQIASVSVGIFNGTPVLDLDYAEDSNAETDMNVVMNSDNGYIEVQGTAEGHPYSKDELNSMLTLAEKGINELFSAQQAAISD